MLRLIIYCFLISSVFLFASYLENRKLFSLVYEFADNGEMFEYFRKSHQSMKAHDYLNITLQIARLLICLHDEEIFGIDIVSEVYYLNCHYKFILIIIKFSVPIFYLIKIRILNCQVWGYQKEL